MEERWKKKTDGGDGFFPPDHPRDSSRSSAPPSPQAAALKALVSASSRVLLLAFPSWVFPMNAPQGPTPDSSSAPCPVSSSQESWKLSSSLSLKMFKLHPEPQLSQHQLLITVQSKLPCCFPHIPGKVGQGYDEENSGTFQLPATPGSQGKSKA